ncbi:PP2C family protein-serine/threonine phosphatase [Mycolicibacterium sp.]|uniref:PP2C family protein-serine/threonine phosphatase n=1 Tax=Mycolicibacterium sp. TaxID=2320850 RepID=UPI003D0B04B5
MSAVPLEERFALAPEVEEDRLRAVEQLYLLDSAPEERFAQITRMARFVFEVPMAAVSLLDRDRQWFKQCDGLDLSGSVPRGQTVCQATIKRGYDHPEDPGLILEDTLDSEFCELPAICGAGGIRFYAGYPLFGPGGHPVGTFCIYDTKPRQLSSTQRDTFVELAAWAQRELQSTDDLERAANVQRQLLPPPLGDLPGYTVCAVCLPAYAVGGDFYDHYPVQGGTIFTVADVMGKGLGAAILTATVRSALRGASRAIDGVSDSIDLAHAVNATYQQIRDDLSSTDSFVTLFHFKVGTDDGLVQFVDAGHGFAVVIRADGSVLPLNSEDLPLGVLPEDRWDAHEVVLEPGDSLIVASDGVLDLVGGGDDIRAAVKFVAQHADPTDLCAQAHIRAKGAAPVDDITIVAIRREPSP